MATRARAKEPRTKLERAKSSKASPRKVVAMDRGPLSWVDMLGPTVTRRDAARYSNFSERTVDRAIAAGELDTLVHGRRRVVLRESFKRWLTKALHAGAR